MILYAILIIIFIIIIVVDCYLHAECCIHSAKKMRKYYFIYNVKVKANL